MAGTRTCGKRCHGAAHAACRCWCGGLFHGERGSVARAVFTEVFGAPIPDRDPRMDEPLLHWSQVDSRFSRALQCARVAHGASNG